MIVCYRGRPSLGSSAREGRRWCSVGPTLIRPVIVLFIAISSVSFRSTNAWSPELTVGKRAVVFPAERLLSRTRISNDSGSSLVRSSFGSVSMSATNAHPSDAALSTNGDSRRGTDSSSVQQRLLEQKQRKPPTIITCSSTKEIVHAIKSIVTPDHVVAELGSQLRDISTTIRDRASPESVYVDVKRNFPKAQQSKKTNPSKDTKRISSMRLGTGKNESVDANSADESLHTGFDFREIDKFSDWRSSFFQSSSSSSLSLSSSNCYDILVLDVNAIVGNDLEWTCLDLILEFEQMAAIIAASRNDDGVNSDDTNDPSYHGLQYVLVKSLGLNSVASQLTYTVPWLDPNKTNHNRLCRIVATVGVHDYRQTIPGVLNLLQQSHLKSKSSRDSGEQSSASTNFFVLEVGCHFGTSTVLLSDFFDDVMGVDVGSKIIKEAQKKYPGVFFRTGDAWKTAGLLRLQQEYYREKEDSRKKTALEDGSESALDQGNSDSRIGFDAVYVDVGGLSGADGLLDTIALVKSIQYALEPQCIVVKSLCLQRLASRFTPYWKWQKKGENELN